MKVIAELLVDRYASELVSLFVLPLDGVLREARLGRVLSHSVDGPFLEVKLAVAGSSGFDRILQFFAEADAPVGTIVYQVEWFRRKLNIFVLGPEGDEGTGPLT